MEFRILGPLDVIEDGRRIPLGAKKQRALLAALLLEANRVVSTDRLVDALWEDQPPETASKALQVYVSQLRKLIGKERLQTRPPGYVLRVEASELDLAAFRRLQEEGALDEALALWRGPALPELADGRALGAEIARLEELRLACLEQRIESGLAEGRAAELIPELESLVVEHPLRESLRARLMLALYRSGRQADALNVYLDARETLVEELGIDPGKPLRELYQAILKQDPALDLPAEEPTDGEAARAPFVGRERELAALVEGVGDVFAGRGRLFLLVGEPGIGKSRLADELTARARARGARVVAGRCWEAGGAPAYWPWVQSLRACLPAADPEALRGRLGAGASDLAQLLPELHELLPGLAEPPPLESESARFRLFEAASAFLLRSAEERPIVLVLDDLHAADEPSLLLLRFLARQLGESRLLVVGAYRDLDPSPTAPLRATVTELAREPATTILALAGLASDDVARFIELATGEIPSDDLVSLVHEETEGNPLFVGEIVRLRATEGPEQAAGSRLVIPQSVRDVIARRVSHLSEDCNRMLLLASVLGREFALDALQLVTGTPKDELLELLDEALAARVLSDVPGSSTRLRFAHVLIRDTLYDGLTSARRVRLHRAALLGLEALYGAETGPNLAELAYHAVAGSEFAGGLDYARRAGDRALALLAYEEAARLYGTALDALALSDPADESTRCELLLSLGEAESRAGHSAAAKEAAFEAAEIARRLGLARELARAAADYGGRIVWARAADDRRLVPLLEEGLAALGDDDAELRVRLLSRLSGALRDEPSRVRREELSREAVELARRTGNPAALGHALDGRLYAIIAPDRIAEGLDLGVELCDVAGQAGDAERLLQGHMHKLVAYLTLGEVDEAVPELTRASEISDALRQPVQLWQVRGAQAMLALAAGRLAEGERLSEEAFELGRDALPAAIPHRAFQRYIVCDFRSRLDEVEETMRAIAAAHPARPIFRCALAHVHARQGRSADARQELDRLADAGFAALPFDMEWLVATSLLAETCALVGDAERADVLYDLLVPYAALNAVDTAEGMRGSMARYVGLLAATTSRWDEAVRSFEDALAANERMGARPWLAHTEADYARMLLARGSAADRERSARLLAAAAATYLELGMESWAADASGLAKGTSPSAARR